jgi:hypothetical protein
VGWGRAIKDGVEGGRKEGGAEYQKEEDRLAIADAYEDRKQAAPWRRGAGASASGSGDPWGGYTGQSGYSGRAGKQEWGYAAEGWK